MKPFEKSKEKDGITPGDVRPKLTATEAEILSLFTIEKLTPAQIAARKGHKNRNSVYAHLSNLRRKGYLTKANTMSKGLGGGVPLRPLDKHHKKTSFRLEAQQLVGRILWKGDNYDKLLKASNALMDVYGAYVRLNKDTVELYLNKVFYGKDWPAAWSDSLTYIERVIRQLEHRLNVVLIKPGYANWKFVKVGEHATEGEALALKAYEEGQTLRLYNKRDGKLWYVADWSKVIEGETMHPERGYIDRAAIDRHMWDWSQNPDVPTLSELSGLLRQVLSAQERLASENAQTAAGLKAVVDIMKEQFKPPKGFVPDVRPLREYTG